MIKSLLKIVISALIALAVLTGFCFFYYNLPVHHDSPTGSSDYIWDANAISMKCTEGFAYSVTDANGFPNAWESNKEEIDVLVMGSSHGEGFNVSYDENFTYVLNEIYAEKGEDFLAYNISTSGHSLVHCFRNLEAGIKEFSPDDYVVIETPNLSMTMDKLIDMQEGDLPRFESNDSEIIKFLQRNDFFRLAYSQGYSFLNKSKPFANTNADDPIDFEQYEILMEKIVVKAAETVAKADCKLIIVYLPELSLNTDGSVNDQEIIEQYTILKKLCDKHGVIFVDMYEPFKTHYEETYELPNGFSNTKVGTGHINTTGHRLVAETLYEITKEDCSK